MVWQGAGWILSAYLLLNCYWGLLAAYWSAAPAPQIHVEHSCPSPRHVSGIGGVKDNFKSYERDVDDCAQRRK